MKKNCNIIFILVALILHLTSAIFADIEELTGRLGDLRQSLETLTAALKPSGAPYDAPDLGDPFGASTGGTSGDAPSTPGSGKKPVSKQPTDLLSGITGFKKATLKKAPKAAKKPVEGIKVGGVGLADKELKFAADKLSDHFQFLITGEAAKKDEDEDWDEHKPTKVEEGYIPDDQVVIDKALETLKLAELKKLEEKLIAKGTEEKDAEAQASIRLALKQTKLKYVQKKREEDRKQAFDLLQTAVTAIKTNKPTIPAFNIPIELKTAELDKLLEGMTIAQLEKLNGLATSKEESTILLGAIATKKADLVKKQAEEAERLRKAEERAKALESLKAAVNAIKSDAEVPEFKLPEGLTSSEVKELLQGMNKVMLGNLRTALEGFTGQAEYATLITEIAAIEKEMEVGKKKIDSKIKTLASQFRTFFSSLDEKPVIFKPKLQAFDTSFSADVFPLTSFDAELLKKVSSAILKEVQGISKYKTTDLNALVNLLVKKLNDIDATAKLYKRLRIFLTLLEGKKPVELID